MIKEFYASHYWLGFILKIAIFGGWFYLLLTDSNFSYFIILVLGFIILMAVIDRYVYKGYGKPNRKGLEPYRTRSSMLKQLLDFFHPKRGYFVCGIDDSQLRLPELAIPFNKINSIHPEKGGSEAYLLLEDDTRVELNFSWLSRTNKKQVVFLIKNQLNEHA